MFKRLIFFSTFIFSLALVLSSCVGVQTTSIQSTKQNINEAVKYQGPKARIAVARFDCKAAKCYGDIGEGIKDMLIDALVQTNRFIVLERGEGFEAIKEEVDLAQSGYIQQRQAPQKGLMEGADIIVLGSIVAFEPNASGVSGGVGALLSKVPMIGGVKIGKQDAYIAAIIRLVDVRTGRIIHSTRIEGKASSFKIGGLGGWLAGSVGLGGGLSVYKNTPMEKAVMVLIDNAVKEIVKYVPENYYRYSATGQVIRPVNNTANTQPTTQKPQNKTIQTNSQQYVGVEGAWHGTYRGQFGGGEWSWVIRKNPDGTYSGVMNSTGIYPGQGIPIQISVNGNKIKVGWAGGPGTVYFEGVINNNTIKGNWYFVNGGDKGTFEGVKGRNYLTPQY